MQPWAVPIQPLHLTISTADLEVLFDRADEAAPEECCGILLGVRDLARWRVLRLVPCENMATERLRRFEIGPTDLVRARRVCRDTGLEILGFFHSHPSAGTEPSRRDRVEGWGGHVQVIVGGGRPWKIAAWTWSDSARQPRTMAIKRAAA